MSPPSSQNQAPESDQSVAQSNSNRNSRSRSLKTKEHHQKQKQQQRIQQQQDEQLTEVFQDEPCNQLKELYKQDKDIVDDEFEAYAQEYYERKKEERNRSSPHQASRCRRICPWILVGLLVQLFTIGVLLVLYVSVEKSLSLETGMLTPARDIPGIPEEIFRVCHLDNIIDNYQECQELCAPAACCYKPETDPEHCWIDEPNLCRVYHKVCAVLGLQENHHSSNTPVTVYPNAVVLWNHPEELPPAPTELLTTCQEGLHWMEGRSDESESEVATQTCHEICHMAACCWDSRLTEHPADRCWTHPNCWEYTAACSFLLEEQAEPEKLPSNEYVFMLHSPAEITQLCQPDKINDSLDNLLACQEACLPVECCWNAAYINSCDGRLKCEGYRDACAVLNSPLPVVTIHDVQTTSPSSTSLPVLNDMIHNEVEEAMTTYSPEIIRDVCLNHDNNVRLPGHKSLCEQVCQPGACCFSTPEEADCPSYLPEDYCDKYQPCLGDLDSRIEKACTNLEDLTDCVQLCATGTCCFTTYPWKTCIVTQPNTVCSTYEPCEILYRKHSDANNDENSSSQSRNGEGRHLIRRNR